MQGLVYRIRGPTTPILRVSKVEGPSIYNPSRTNMQVKQICRLHTKICKGMNSLPGDIHMHTYRHHRSILTIPTRLRNSAPGKARAKLQKFQDSKFIKSSSRFKNPKAVFSAGLSLGERQGESTYTRQKGPYSATPPIHKKTHQGGVQSTSTHPHTPRHVNGIHVTHKHSKNANSNTYTNTVTGTHSSGNDAKVAGPGTYTPSDSTYMTRLRESPNPVPVWANYKYANQPTATLGDNFQKNLTKLSQETTFLKIAKSRAEMSGAAVKAAVENIERNGLNNTHDKRSIALHLRTVFGLRDRDGEPGKFTLPSEVTALEKLADLLKKYKGDAEASVMNSVKSSLHFASVFQEPHLWFPAARMLTRDIHVHMGPTNSGKTHSALTALKQAKSGCFAGPLRLLAWEVFDKFTLGDDPIQCNLLTGQEKVQQEGAKHTSSTVELVDVNTHVDVAVIDEIQMIADEDRGWWWVRAVLGVPANELHLCGDHTALSLLKRFTDITGDNLIVHEYTRLSELEVCGKEEVLHSLEQIEPGDGLVCFSQKKIHKYKQEIERNSNLKCSVVYGSLPPENRKRQAEMFNNKETQVLIATDAIGMGLNLQIRRVIFSTMSKYDGVELRPLRATEVKQIGGRAGRYMSEYPRGYVTVLQAPNHAHLEVKMNEPLLQIKRGGLLPSDEIMAYVQETRPHMTLEEILSDMEVIPKSKHSMYFMCNLDLPKIIAKLLNPIPTEKLGVVERWQYTCAPLNQEDSLCQEHMFDYVSKFCEMNIVPYPEEDMSELEKCVIPTNALALSDLANQHMRMDLYLWFNTKHGDYFFPDVEKVTEARIICTQLIEAGLFQMTAENVGDVDADKVPAVARPSWLTERRPFEDIYAGVAIMPSKRSEKVAFEAVRAGLQKFVYDRADMAGMKHLPDAEVGDIVNSKFF